MAVFLAMAIGAAWAEPARAQERATNAAAAPVAVVVEQIVAADVYASALDSALAASLASAPAAGDSVTARAGGAALRGLVIARSGRRFVVRLGAGGARPALGDTLLLERIAPLAVAVLPDSAPPAAAPAPPTGPVAQPVRPAPARPPVDVTGRIGLSANTIHSAGSWAEAEETWTRTDATPAARAYLRVDHLPGDLRVTLNGRADRRFDLEDSGPAGDLTARVYEAHVEKRFDALPLHVRLGRFRNPYEPFGDPVDGALLRLGIGSGFGVGAVGGLRTRWSDVELSTELPVARAFVDWDWSGGSRFVHAVVSGGQEFADSGARTIVGAEQSLGWGPARLSSDVRAARAPDGGWTLSDVQVAGSVRPVTPLRLSLRYSHAGDAWSWTGWQTTDARHRVGAGIGWTGSLLSAGADFATSRTEPRDPAGEARTGRTVSARAQLDEPFARLSPGVSATWWQDDADRSVVQIAPSLSRALGDGRVRAEYRWERSESKGVGAQSFTTHGVSASLLLPMGPFYLQVSGDHRTGGGIATTRVYTGIEARLR